MQIKSEWKISFLSAHSWRFELLQYVLKLLLKLPLDVQY